MSSHSQGGARRTVAVRAAATWILAGALFKLLVGSPNDLPETVRDFSSHVLGLGALLTFQLAIAIELTIAAIAWLRPDRGWVLVTAQLALFCVVLVPLAMAGAASCGCFGSKVPVPPWAMLSIDGSLLTVVLASQPWRAARAAHRRWGLVAACTAVAWIAPFTLTHSASREHAGSGGTASTGPVALGRAIADWRPEDWVGRALNETAVADLVAVDEHQLDATWVIYRPTCDHCAEVLRRLEGEFTQRPQAFVLLQLPPDEGLEIVVDIKPPAEEIVLPPEIEYVIKPPWVLRVDAGVVRSATQPAE